MKTFRYPAVDLNKPKGVVFLKHGLYTHSARYAHIAKKFAQAGYDVVAFDIKGHGQSGGLPGYIHSLQDLAEQHF